MMNKASLNFLDMLSVIKANYVYINMQYYWTHINWKRPNVTLCGQFYIHSLSDYHI